MEFFFFLNRLKSSYKDYKKNHILLQILLFHCAHYDELLHCSVFSSAKDAQINIYGAKTAWFQVLHMYSLSRPSVISTLWKIQALYWFLGTPVICFIAIHNCIYLDETENTILEWNSVIGRKSTKISDWLKKKHNTYLQIKNLSLIVQKWTYQESTAFLVYVWKTCLPYVLFWEVSRFFLTIHTLKTPITWKTANKNFTPAQTATCAAENHFLSGSERPLQEMSGCSLIRTSNERTGNNVLSHHTGLG